MKYKLTKQTRIVDEHILHRVQALKNFGGVKKGDLGGWIETEDNLSQDGNAWVRDNACVSENARVFGDAQIYDNAQISGHAYIWGNAQVCDNARVFGYAQIRDDAQVFGSAWVFDTARVYDNARVSGNAWVFGTAQIGGNLKIIGGEFYHTQDKSAIVEKINNDNEFVTLCSNPKFAEEESKGKKVKIKLAEGIIIEGELIED